MKNIGPLLTVLITATVTLPQPAARADSAAAIQGLGPSGAASVTWDDNGSGNYPVVSAILTHPGTVTGTAGTRTYSNWSLFGQDTTGSLDLFYPSSVSSHSVQVGDQFLVQGKYAPFSGIPEIQNPITTLTWGSSGNPLYSASPVSTTIPTINVGTNGLGLSASGLSGQMLTLHNVTISGAGASWSGNPNVNVTAQISDQSANSMTLFVWGTSYYDAGAIIGSGGAVPTGLVDMTGFLSDFYNTTLNQITPEFIPLSITQVPEPAATAVCGLGSVLAFVCYRLPKKV
jgi:hypothetical protein